MRNWSVEHLYGRTPSPHPCGLKEVARNGPVKECITQNRGWVTGSPWQCKTKSVRFLLRERTSAPWQHELSGDVPRLAPRNRSPQKGTTMTGLPAWRPPCRGRAVVQTLRRPACSRSQTTCSRVQVCRHRLNVTDLERSSRAQAGLDKSQKTHQRGRGSSTKLRTLQKISSDAH